MTERKRKRRGKPLPIPQIKPIKPVKIDGKNVWLPVLRLGSAAPFGYEKHPTDPDILLPVPEQLELLEQAKKLLKEYSLRDVALWLSDHSGRSISHMGLKKRVELESKKINQEIYYRQLAKSYERVLAKIEHLEKTKLGRRESPSNSETGGD